MSVRFVPALVLSLLALAACGAKSNSGSSGYYPDDGTACDTAGAFKCDGAVSYECTANLVWEGTIDCGKSTTAGCTCTIDSTLNVAVCTYDNGANSCQGATLSSN